MIEIVKSYASQIYLHSLMEQKWMGRASKILDRIVMNFLTGGLCAMPEFEPFPQETENQKLELKSQNSIGGWASLVAQLVKNSPAVWETWVQSLGWEDPLEKRTATHSRGHKESDTTSTFTSLSRMGLGIILPNSLLLVRKMRPRKVIELINSVVEI